MEQLRSNASGINDGAAVIDASEEALKNIA
jgi:hypothetical protein